MVRSKLESPVILQLEKLLGRKISQAYVDQAVQEGWLAEEPDGYRLLDRGTSVSEGTHAVRKVITYCRWSSHQSVR